MASDSKDQDHHHPKSPKKAALYRRAISTTSSQHKNTKRIRHRRTRNRKRSIVKILNKEKDRIEEESLKNSVSPVKLTCKNIVYFVLLYSTVLCCRAAIDSYIEGMTEEIQRRYSFSKSQISLIEGTQVIGLVVSLPLVALLGRNCHKPLLVMSGVLVCSLGTIICPVPYFVEKSLARQPINCSYGLPSQLAFTQKSIGLPLSSYSQACQLGQWNTSYIEPCSTCLTNNDWLNDRQTSLSILCVAGFLIGLGTGLFVTTGFVYVEENSNGKNGPIFYGVFLSMTSFGQFLGSCIVWWFLDYTEDLNDELDVRFDWTTKAWWLGFVFFCALLIICSCLFLFFPKWISEPDWSSTDRRRRLRILTKRLEHEKEHRRRRQMRRRRERNNRLRGKTSSGQRLTRTPSNEYICERDLVTPDPTRPRSAVQVTRSNSLDDASAFDDLEGNDLGSTKESTTDPMEADDSSSSSSSDSDSETIPAKAEAVVTSLQRTSGGNGSGLGIIVEEDSHFSEFPSSALSPPVANPELSVMDEVDEGEGDGDGRSPVVWPLHNQPDDNRQSRVVTFASVVPDATGNQSNNPTGLVGSERTAARPSRRTGQQIKKTIAKPFTALKRVFLTPVFSLCLIGTLLSAYLSAGYRSNVARFTEVNYDIPHIYAWFYSAGLCYSLAETLGTLVGGIIVHKLRLSLYKQVQMIISLLIINIILFLLIFPIRHSNHENQLANATSSGSSFSSCSAKCDCLGVQLQPVCSKDGLSFSSACQAGCTQLTLQNSSLIYYNCSCVSGDLASDSFCSNGSPVYGAFWVLLFLAIFAHSLGQVSIILIFLRSVQEVDRHLSLSAAIWVIVVAAFIPGPAVFDALEGTSCTSSRSNCYDEDTCWVYDRDNYRYVIHGTNAAFQFVSTGFFIAALYFLRKDPIEPVGYGKEDFGKRKTKDQEEEEERATDGGDRSSKAGKQSEMEVVQSRIASNLLANKPELMKFQSSSLPRLSSNGSEDERNRKSSNDSVFVRDEANNSLRTEIREEEEESVRGDRTLSDQSNDSVFVSNHSTKEVSSGGQINNAFESQEASRTSHPDRDILPGRAEDTTSVIDDMASTITESTRL